MSQIDDSRYRRQIRQQLDMRARRNAQTPVMLPDSGVIPRFPADLNRAKQPTNLGTTSFYQYQKARQNQGSRPQGSQRFPKSVRSPTELIHASLRRKPVSGVGQMQPPFVPRGGR